MSADHRRPLFAFVLVLVVCVIIMVNGLKGQAVVVALRTGAVHVVEGVELVTIRGDHGHQARQLMQPPVLQVGATTVFVDQQSTPATTPSSTAAPSSTAGHAPGQASGHHGQGAPDKGPGHPRSHASQEPVEQVVHGLSQQVEQLLGVHGGAGPSRGPGAGVLRGHGRGADHARGAEQGRDGGRAGGHGVRGNDRGLHLGRLLGHRHGARWARHR